jgi:hypothetical protein
MPMCQIAAPPAIRFWWPTEDPQGWLTFFFVAFLVVVVLVLTWITQTNLRTAVSRAGRTRTLILLLALLCFIASMALATAVTFPSNRAQSVWYFSQESALLAKNCSTVALRATDHRLFEQHVTLVNIQTGLIFAGLALYVLNLVPMIWRPNRGNAAASPADSAP